MTTVFVKNNRNDVLSGDYEFSGAVVMSGDVTLPISVTAAITDPDISAVNVECTTISCTTCNATTGNIVTVAATTVGATTGNLDTVNADDVNSGNATLTGVLDVTAASVLPTLVNTSDEDAPVLEATASTLWALSNGEAVIGYVKVFQLD